MNMWPYAVGSYSPSQVQEYCVQDAEWQEVRLSMKGIPTTKKLTVLNVYRNTKKMEGNGELAERHRIQVDNYINALKRGGQLNMKLEVAK